MLARRLEAHVHLALRRRRARFLRALRPLGPLLPPLLHLCALTSALSAAATAARGAQHAVLDHQRRQDALAQTAVGNSQALARPQAQDRLEDGAAGEHEVGAVAADARLGDALLVGAAEQVVGDGAHVAQTLSQQPSTRLRS